MDIVDIVDILWIHCGIFCSVAPLSVLRRIRESSALVHRSSDFFNGEFFLIGDFWTGVGGCKMLLRGKRYS